MDRQLRRHARRHRRPVASFGHGAGIAERPAVQRRKSAGANRRGGGGGDSSSRRPPAQKYGRRNCPRRRRESGRATSQGHRLGGGMDRPRSRRTPRAGSISSWMITCRPSSVAPRRISMRLRMGHKADPAPPILVSPSTLLPTMVAGALGIWSPTDQQRVADRRLRAIIPPTPSRPPVRSVLEIPRQIVVVGTQIEPATPRPSTTKVPASAWLCRIMSSGAAAE